MSTRKTGFVYTLLILVSGLVVGMVIASRLDLAPSSAAQNFTTPPMNSAPVTGALDAQTFRNVAKAVSPIVVNIRTESRQRMRDLSDFFGGQDDFFRRFFEAPGPGEQGGGRGRQPREQTTVAAGTGFIISRDGLILTNNHVVEGATKIEVSLYGEDPDQVYEAKLIGRDELTESALIQLTQKPNYALPEAKFGDSSQMAAGDWVMAIGNPFNYAHTVSVGVISAVERPFPISLGRRTAMLQTDAAINPGNSGGPLVNLRGEVIGMNTAIISNGRVEGNIGIGFAIPINTVRDLLPQLHTGKVIRGRIGVEVNVVPREGYEEFGLKSATGAIVARIAPGGAADKGGIEPGDVIVEFNGRPVPNTNDLVNMVTATKPGTSVAVKVMRNRRERALTVVVEELDLAAEQQATSRASARELPDNQSSEGFGLSLQNLTPQQARRLELPSGRTGALVAEVDPDGAAARAVRPADVILEVNRERVSNATEASRELARVASGRIAQLLLWRDGAQVFVTVRKD